MIHGSQNRPRNPKDSDSNMPSGLEKCTLGLSVANLAVLAITMGAAIIYACEAHKQNRLLADSIVQQTLIIRPVLLADPVRPEGTNAYPSEATANIVNFGKTVALEVVAPGELISAASEEPAPHDPRCNINGGPPKDSYMTALAPVDAMTENRIYYPAIWHLSRNEDISKMEGRMLYAVGCVYYEGLDGRSYYSDICTKWVSGNFQGCDSRTRNLIK
jgi:hypothetical protein